MAPPYKLWMASSGLYRKLFATFLNKDKAKLDFLLGFWVKHHENVVDNLTTKDSHSDADVEQRLMDINTSDAVYNSAQFVSKPSGDEKKVKNQSKPVLTTPPPPQHRKLAPGARNIIPGSANDIPAMNAFSHRSKIRKRRKKRNRLKRKQTLPQRLR